MLLTSKNRTLVRSLTHVLVWILLLLLPFMLSYNENEGVDYFRMMKISWIPMFFYAVIFYLNYFSLIDCFLYQRKRIAFILINLSLIVLFVWLHFELREFMNMITEIKPPHGPKKHGPPMQLFLYKDFVSMFIPAIIAFAIKTSEKWKNTEIEKKEREKEILNSELQQLKYQLQPHFFFNSLNTIYALIERSPIQAQETVHSLGKLMRYMLYDTESGKTSLENEIAFMNQYINLMKLRISDKTTIHTDFPKHASNIEISPFLFISLIENAFKHGVSSTLASEIKFKLTLEGKKVFFYSENTNFQRNETDKSGSGIGLNNLKKRLQLSYPGKYNFKTSAENKVYTVSLEIDLD